ncbi:MAG: transglutaminase N-terminal domain-containing protein [Pirellulaceae bacterium]
MSDSSADLASTVMSNGLEAIYRLSHKTTYLYDQPVRVSHNAVMLTPRSDGVAVPVSYRIAVTPQPELIRRREDYFGNHVQTFSLQQNHRELSVIASGRVRIRVQPIEKMGAPWEEVLSGVSSQTDTKWFDVCQYSFASPRIRIGQAFREYALKSFLPNRSIGEAALELTHRIYDDFEYDSKATEVHTPTQDAFEMRRGVCQDFAHIQLACLRAIGLSARYVSGYLRTSPLPGQERLVGSDQSHAWVSLYCGSEIGWFDLDPTNDCAVGVDHIPVAWGRDYNDVIPVRGVFLGGGKHTIRVSVDVERVSA